MKNTCTIYHHLSVCGGWG